MAEKTIQTIDDVEVRIEYATEETLPISEEEIRAYIQRGNLRKPNSTVSGLNLLLDGSDVEITYEYEPIPFERIRRITGYLVGTMDRWNDAKTAEESDRVKHDVSCSCGCR